MASIALTWKHSRKKYARANDGELMLVHCCRECGGLSINRLAADDDSAQIALLLRACEYLDCQTLDACAASGIRILGAADAGLVSRALFGREV